MWDQTCPFRGRTPRFGQKERPMTTIPAPSLPRPKPPITLGPDPSLTLCLDGTTLADRLLAHASLEPGFPHNLPHGAFARLPGRSFWDHGVHPSMLRMPASLPSDRQPYGHAVVDVQSDGSAIIGAVSKQHGVRVLPFAFRHHPERTMPALTDAHTWLNHCMHTPQPSLLYPDILPLAPRCLETLHAFWTVLCHMFPGCISDMFLSGGVVDTNATPSTWIIPPSMVVIPNDTSPLLYHNTVNNPLDRWEDDLLEELVERRLITPQGLTTHSYKLIIDNLPDITTSATHGLFTQEVLTAGHRRPTAQILYAAPSGASTTPSAHQSLEAWSTLHRTVPDTATALASYAQANAVPVVSS